MKYIFALLMVASFLPSAHAKSDRAADLQYYLCNKPHVVREALNLKKFDGKSREVYLFETSKLDLFDRHLQIRLRVKKSNAQLSIKRFDLSETEFTNYQNKLDGKCEMDVHGKGQVHVLSCSVDQKISSADAQKLIDGKMNWETELSDQQKTLLTDAGVNAAVLDKTRALGPIESRAWDFHVSDLPNDLSLEQQELPSGARYIEFSVKTDEGELSSQIRSAELLFAAKDLFLCADQSGQRKEKLNQLLFRRQ